MADKDFLQELQATNVIPSAQLSRAQQLSHNEAIGLEQAILRLGLMEQKELLVLSARVGGQKFVSEESDIVLDNVRLTELSHAYCVSHTIVPVVLDRTERVILTGEMRHDDLHAEVSFLLEERPVWALATSTHIRALLLSGKDHKPQTATEASAEQVQKDTEKYKKQSVDGPSIRFVDQMFEDAVTLGASDIHFESLSDGLRVRFRLNGVLKVQNVDANLSASGVLARLKVMANLNVSERRLPQDGRIGITLHGRVIDVRVSTIPTSHGESIACRLLDPKSLKLDWAQLGFADPTAQSIQDLIERPHGLFLVTGPTGSGKTTTLYTALSHLNDDSQKILSVEDPVEYNLDGVDQVQVNEAVGMTFAKALRAFLRQDPNIIMIGEIRDQETAEIACRSALVGRLVLSTLHTNSPHDAATRLQDLGVPKYILDSVLLGALGQKLEPGQDNKRILNAELVTF